MSGFTLGSLFDGIGGFPLAAIQCGIQPVWASEIEAFPIEVTKHHFPTMIHVGDITKLNGAELPPVDIICGGSPCQDLSVAGTRAGLSGSRSGLFLEQVRLVKEMRYADEQRGRAAQFVRPRWMCWENVPGAFSSGDPKGEDFRIVLEEIVRIKCDTAHVPEPYPWSWQPAGRILLGDDFSLAWRVLDAQYWGVPQRRRRIFLVADFAGLSAPKILFEQNRLPGYADEGITGTSAKKRKDFLQMIRDCERGKIDLVITKSVSRFCRNTLDGLNYVRRLKRHGVGVYFEKENVNTLFMDNEMILTFMMSQAQAESESLSGNVRWGHRKNFKDGKVYYHCKTFLGYRWGADGQPEIDPEQAAIVRRIFSRFLLGHSVRQITTDLMADGIKTATGKTVWHDSVVQKMLCNEKYIGDAILQKTYIADLFTREKRVNNGELPKYYVHDCHPAIIDRETFQKVQEELARRSSLKKTSSKAKTQLGKYCGKYVLSELLVCGECGSPYRRVIWTQKGAKRVVWRCQNRLEHGRKICKQSPTLDEGDIHDAVISAMNELFRMQAAKDAVKAGIAAVLAGEEQTMSLPAVELQIRNLQERQLELFQLIVSAGADCTDYDEELQQVNIAKTRLMAQKAELEKEQRGAAAFESRLAELDMALEQASGTLTDFDELTVRQLVSNIKVLDKDSLLICFKDGTEITQAMQRRQTA